MSHACTYADVPVYELKPNTVCKYFLLEKNISSQKHNMNCETLIVSNDLNTP